MIDYDKIASSCSIHDAISITGAVLKTGGGARAEPQVGTKYLSPFRAESNPSFTLYHDAEDQHWRWHDHAFRKGGNMINFVEESCQLSVKDSAIKINEYLKLGAVTVPKKKKEQVGQQSDHRLNDLKLEPLTEEQLQQLAEVIGIKGVEGIKRTAERMPVEAGILYRRNPSGGQFAEENIWALYDQFTNAATCRKLNGKLFGKHKSLSPNGWKKRPIGMGATEGDHIYDESWNFICAEGEKDLLALMHGIDYERAVPVCMPSASVRFKELAERTRGASVSIYAHADKAGIEAALAWYEELRPYAFEVRAFVPKVQGQDWADIASGLTAEEMEGLLSDELLFDCYLDEGIKTLDPECFEKAKRKEYVPSKGGSALDVAHMALVYRAWLSLDEKDRGSVAAVCRVLGVPTRGAQRAKVDRALKNCQKQVHAEALEAELAKDNL